MYNKFEIPLSRYTAPDAEMILAFIRSSRMEMTPLSAEVRCLLSDIEFLTSENCESTDFERYYWPREGDILFESSQNHHDIDPESKHLRGGKIGK